MNSKKVIILILAFAVVYALTFLVRQSDLYENWVSPKTTIQFHKRSYDFGNIPSQKKASVYFVYRNTGRKALKIDQIETRCGCTVSSWPETLLEPNMSDSILVEYDAEQVGLLSKEVYVFSNAETSPDLLYIKGNVIKRDTLNSAGL